MEDFLPDEAVTSTAANVEIVETVHGSFEFVQSVTLGDCLIALSILLLLAFHVLKWLMESVWRRGGR